MIIDLIHIKNGKLERFGISYLDDYKRIFLNNDGSFEYYFNIFPYTFK